MNHFEGNFQGEGLKVALVVARFNEVITHKLMDGALDCLSRHGVSQDDINTYWVPGAFEAPVVAERILQKEIFDAVIVLGCVIQGETPHFDQVVGGVTSGCMNLSLKHGKPVIFGVLTTDTVEQAMNRSGIKAGNKGWDCAMSALEMSTLLKKI